MEQYTPGNDRSRINQANIPLAIPHDLQAEQAVLAALMTDSSAPAQVADQLSPEVFYDPAHQVIYQAIAELYEQNKPIDLISVNHQLTKKNLHTIAHAPAYLIELSQKIFSSAYLEYHTKILIEHYLKRRIHTAGSMLMKKAYDAGVDPIELLDEATEIIHNTIEKRLHTPVKNVSKAFISTLKTLSNTSIGIDTGIGELNEKLVHGLKPGELYILAARPSMGKTAMMLTIAQHIGLKQRKRVLIYSLEMTAEQIILRLISMHCCVPMRELTQSTHSQELINKLLTAKNGLENAEIYIDDSPSLHIKELKARARKFHQKHQIACIMVDYLQLCDGTSSKNTLREHEISAISKGLKHLAKELNVPVLALSQVNRAVESRIGSKRPLLSDLRESGAIEQDADVVLFLYRPEYYGFETWEDGSSCQGQAELIIAKHRNGPTGTVRLKYEAAYTLFTTL